MADEVYMNIPAVRGIAQQCQQFSETLNRVNTALGSIADMLRASAFFGLVGNAALASYIDAYRPRVERMANKCAELSQDLNASITAYENGDQQGATRFF